MTLVQTEPKSIKIGGWTDTTGPCPYGFHVPTKDDSTTLYNMFTAMLSGGTNFETYLKRPRPGTLGYNTGTKSNEGTIGYCWLSTHGPNTNNAYYMGIYGANIYYQGVTNINNGYNIRPFKNTPETPDSTWTVLYQGTGSAGIYHNTTRGLISISSDGNTWITIADKNLGATTVYNYGDTLSAANCGNFYQRGNNYGFAWTGAGTTSATQVNASTYGPGNYYNSSTFITTQPRDSSYSTNLRGGEDTSIKAKEIKRIMIRPNGTEKQIRPEIPDYLCFTANTANSTVKLTKTGSPTAVTLETSTDGSTWSTYTFGSTITLSSIGDKVYWRNTSETTTGFSTSSSNYYRFILTGSVSASGDINYLLNKNSTTTLISNYCFYYLFYGQSAIISSPQLTATTLTNNCYYEMFNDCANLEVLPILPATILSTSCYLEMFSWCPKIKLSYSQTGEYVNEYKIPITGTGTMGSNSLTDMFYKTGGTFTGTPTVNTTYYTSNTLVG